jgi:hypothetical protein
MQTQTPFGSAVMLSSAIFLVIALAGMAQAETRQTVTGNQGVPFQR